MKFCPNCGAEITEGAKFCPNCGTMIAADPAPKDPLPEKEIFPEPDKKPDDIFGAAPKKNVFETGGTEKTPTLKATRFDEDTYSERSYSERSYSDSCDTQEVSSSTNGFAIASLILGIMAFFLNGLLFIPGILAVVFGIMGLNKAKTCGSGRGIAMAGLILGIITMALYIVLIATAVTLSFMAISL